MEVRQAHLCPRIATVPSLTPHFAHVTSFFGRPGLHGPPDFFRAATWSFAALDISHSRVTV
jgi:hypothetical protein